METRTNITPGSHCTYCGADEDRTRQEGEITRDHVPPKSWLYKPYPDNLTTVDACRGCNEGFKKDDDYVGTFLTLSILKDSSGQAETHFEKVKRSVTHPSATGLRALIMSGAHPSKIHGRTGRPLGVLSWIDGDRVRAVGQRLVGGLYRIEMGHRLPPGHKITVAGKMGLLSDEALTIAYPFTFLKNHRERVYGDAFSYVAAFGPKESVWLIVLHEKFFWGASTLSPDHAALDPRRIAKNKGKTIHQLLAEVRVNR